MYLFRDFFTYSSALLKRFLRRYCKEMIDSLCSPFFVISSLAIIVTLMSSIFAGESISFSDVALKIMTGTLTGCLVSILLAGVRERLTPFRSIVLLTAIVMIWSSLYRFYCREKEFKSMEKEIALRQEQEEHKKLIAQKELEKSFKDAHNGDVNAMCEVGDYYITHHKYNEAIGWLTKSAENGSIRAMSILYDYYANTALDKEKFIYWAKKAGQKKQRQGIL